MLEINSYNNNINSKNIVYAFGTRGVIKNGDLFVLKEPWHSYNTNFNGKNKGLSHDNRVFCVS